uniref:Uncharacterized protein n=1 Tax=Vitis vinifera TaxID=29760 RepID=A5C7B9_VITVI|nr:hypothetical protein VITISV_032175 [Vitis vinifera]
MARTRGAKSSSPSSRKRVPREEPVPDPTSEPSRPKVVFPPAKPAQQKPPARHYLTRYHMEQLLAPRDFFYPRVAMYFYQSMTTKQILEHLGYPSDPQLERKHIFREVFTLDKWNNMTAYRVEQPGRPQPAEIPAARRASPRHIPEGIPIASPVISRAPPITPASSPPSSSAEPRMAIPISEYRELCRSL